ncbi:beta-carotene 15,15'-monooxygenase [Chryseobacterium salviniae]|uniref:Beta-carotene 15,15'-monooxygenase n=1 Tax=Chryseobacterium salviniae TaxID=3101750 RepID=A0ABU6HP71_9FLAO|nr:beta-carotene 15,15'-monooxygenase [Chryseobacterium sp. T9W2-O]MEC3874268.1 beta-carotene 15,15'-monooxygenase [Chryseobacterium sp. T9W2-O]
MSEFNEFDQQGSVPERNTGSIISHAFEMYKGIFLYAIVVMIICVLADVIVQSVTGYNSWGGFRDFRSFDDFEGGDFYNYEYWNGPGASFYYLLSFILNVFLSPLYIGLIYIANKYNTKIAIDFSDLFIGYRQNLSNILIYSLIVNIILGISIALCGLPFFFVFPLFLLGYPVLLFENATAMDAINKTYNIAKENYGTFLGTSLLGLLISAAGFVLCCIGIIVTAPFILAVMYSAYCAYFGKPRQILLNK